MTEVADAVSVPIMIDDPVSDRIDGSSSMYLLLLPNPKHTHDEQVLRQYQKL